MHDLLVHVYFFEDAVDIASGTDKDIPSPQFGAVRCYCGALRCGAVVVDLGADFGVDLLVDFVVASAIDLLLISGLIWG